MYYVFSFCSVPSSLSKLSRILYKRLKLLLLIKVRRWALLAHFPGILPLRASLQALLQADLEYFTLKN